MAAVQTEKLIFTINFQYFFAYKKLNIAYINMIVVLLYRDTCTEQKNRLIRCFRHILRPGGLPPWNNLFRAVA